MTKAEEEENTISLEEENKKLKQQVNLWMDLNSLRDESYFRQQLLITIEKLTATVNVQAMATEKMAAALKDSLKEEE